jgi:hypothetical protein
MNVNERTASNCAASEESTMTGFGLGNLKRVGHLSIARTGQRRREERFEPLPALRSSDRPGVPPGSSRRGRLQLPVS